MSRRWGTHRRRERWFDVGDGEVAATVPAGEYELVGYKTNRGSGAPDGSGMDAVVNVAVTAVAAREGGGSGVRPGGLTE